MMTELLRTLLTLTVLGSVLAVLVLAVRPLIKSRTVYYYLWLLVLLRLCLPVGVTIPLPVRTQAEPPSSAVHQPVDRPYPQGQPAPPPSIQQGEAAGPRPQPETQESRPAIDGRELLASPALWLAVWILGAAFCLGRQVWGYRRLVRLVKENGAAPGEEVLSLLARMNPQGGVGATVCPWVSSPLLIGGLRPLIVLPGGVEPERLPDILAHELTHARRHDLLYKWFAVAVTSLHWFNPLMIVVRRQLARACELSCDAAVVKGLDAAGRRHYGETLLAMAAGQSFERGGLLTATLC